MYDALLLLRRMAEKGLNFPSLALKARIDRKTAKAVVTTGKGHPDSIKAVARVLGFTLPEIVKPIDGNTNGKRHKGKTT